MWNLIKDGSVLKDQMTNRKKDGTSCELQVTISPVSNEETGAVINYVAVCRDITNERKLQRELRQAQKMEAIGTLAGGIAHDFNNILGVILGYTEISFDHVAAGTPLHENLTEVMTAGERAKNLVRQILAFSRQTEQEVKPISITSIIKETVKFIRSTFPSVIEIRQQFKAAYDVIMADPTQIHQIIMNLCTNAKHAIGERAGALEVRLENCNIDSETSRAQGLTPGTYVKLVISDTGCGMEHAMLEKIFDPFFTTKEPGKGTGLGLSVVHGIVKSYGGTVHAYSEPGNGASFSIYFPVINTHQETAPETGHNQITGGTEHILVVDDEENIVKIMHKMLGQLGYTVTPRTSSVEALEAFRNRPHSFDLIITDQTMPNMTGVELAQEMTRIRQDIPIILCTGFSETVTENKARDMCIQAYIMKPVLLKDIAETIKSVLNRVRQQHNGTAN
jgi:signal transduction histidine kinase/CheY-like chemotaxis protein